MSISGEKRSSAQVPNTTNNNNNTKKQKKSGDPELKGNLNEIKVESIDSHILNVAQWEWRYMEARMLGTKFVDEFAHIQTILCQALLPHSGRWLVMREQYNRMCDFKKRISVIKFLQEQIEQCEKLGRDDLADAFGYRLAYWIFSGIINVLEKTERENAFTSIDVQVVDIHAFLQKLVRATTRHLEVTTRLTWTLSAVVKKPDGLADFEMSAFSSQQPMPKPPSRAPSLQLSSSQLRPESSSISQTTKETTNEDSFVTLQAYECFKDLGMYEHIAPWETVREIQPRAAEKLELAFLGIKSTRFPPKTPPGMLLVGGQGTGKTTIPISWARHHGTLLAIIDGSVKGTLQGQTERVLKKIFTQASDAARTGKVVVMLFEEVDHLLGVQSCSDGSSQSINTALTGFVKAGLGDLIAANLPIFIFGATNHPNKLDMQDISRRFTHKMHVSLPKGQYLATVWRNILAKYPHNLSNEEVEGLASISVGYSFVDIEYLVHELAIRRESEHNLTRNWIMIPGGGLKQRWRPAMPDEAAQIRNESAEAMNSTLHETVTRPIDIASIKDYLLGKVQQDRDPWFMTNDPGIDEMMKNWVKKANGFR